MPALKYGRQASTLAAWGLSQGGGGWWHEAACARTPELHTAELHDGWSQLGSLQSHARHICLNHCPVLRECTAEAARTRPDTGVQAGQVWVISALGHGRPAAKQPPDTGCRDWCKDMPAVKP